MGFKLETYKPASFEREIHEAPGMPNSFNTCLLLETLGLTQSFTPAEQNLAPEGTKLVPGKNLEIGALGIDDKQGKPMNQEVSGSRGLWL